MAFNTYITKKKSQTCRLMTTTIKEILIVIRISLDMITTLTILYYISK